MSPDRLRTLCWGGMTLCMNNSVELHSTLSVVSDRNVFPTYSSRVVRLAWTEMVLFPTTFRHRSFTGYLSACLHDMIGNGPPSPPPKTRETCWRRRRVPSSPPILRTTLFIDSLFQEWWSWKSDSRQHGNNTACRPSHRHTTHL